MTGSRRMRVLVCLLTSMAAHAVLADQPNCAVSASWEGGLERSIDWTPADAAHYSGFVISGNTLKIEVGHFNLDATFSAPITRGQPGEHGGTATHLYLTQDDGQLWFPARPETLAPRNVPVTLSIETWQGDPESMTGSVSIGPVTDTAVGPGASRESITVRASVRFTATGRLTHPMFGDTSCHMPSRG